MRIEGLTERVKDRIGASRDTAVDVYLQRWKRWGDRVLFSTVIPNANFDSVSSGALASLRCTSAFLQVDPKEFINVTFAGASTARQFEIPYTLLHRLPTLVNWPFRS